MRNALDEIFLLPGMDVRNIVWADISFCPNYEVEGHFHLSAGHTKVQLSEFTEFLNSVNYSEGFGSQELFGTIVMSDGSWYDRAEYDGSEWWEHRVCPREEDKLREMEALLNEKYEESANADSCELGF